MEEKYLGLCTAAKQGTEPVARKRISGTAGGEQGVSSDWLLLLVFSWFHFSRFFFLVRIQLWEDGLCQDPISRLAQSSGLILMLYCSRGTSLLMVCRLVV